ncbi:lytic transglycosylase domain-containing protein [Paracoccaceae bacterium]|nr:lytic transglycosylase domain-containing protein [Paracoccaceae bacterium]
MNDLPTYIARRTRGLAIVLATVCFSSQASIAAILPDCEAIAAKVETATGLPQGILSSISRVESGHAWPDGSVKGWPWTTNNRGKGKYFQKREEALKYIKKVIDRGDHNIDVGCMQINYRWHGKAFKSLEQMIDPAYNIPYAARFLSTLYERHGNWDKAIKYYHSGNSKYNRAYLARVKKVWPDAQAQIEYASGAKSGTPKTPAEVSRIAGLGFDDLPMPSVLDGTVDQGASLWANTGTGTGTAQASLRDATGALAPSGSVVESAAIIPIGPNTGTDTGVVVDRLVQAQTNTLDFYAMKVTQVATIDEMPPTLSRHFDKIQRFREMLKRPADL